MSHHKLHLHLNIYSRMQQTKIFAITSICLIKKKYVKGRRIIRLPKREPDNVLNSKNQNSKAKIDRKMIS